MPYRSHRQRQSAGTILVSTVLLVLIACAEPAKKSQERFDAGLGDGFVATITVTSRDAAAGTMTGRVTITPPETVKLTSVIPAYEPMQGLVLVVHYTSGMGTQETRRIAIQQVVPGVRLTILGDITWAGESAAAITKKAGS